MSDYLEIRNEAGEVQLYSDIRSYTLVHKGTLTTTNTGSYPQYRIGTPTITNLNIPIVAVRPLNDGDIVCVYSGIKMGSDFAWSFATNVACTFEYYIFDMTPSTTSQTEGFQCWDASGNPVYMSGGGGAFRVVGTGTTVSGLDPSRNYAGVQSHPGLRGYSTGTAPGAPNPFRNYRGGHGVKKVSSTQMECPFFSMWNFPSNSGILYEWGQPNFFVIDVTGY